MGEPWRGIERRLERLDECTSKLEALATKSRADFAGDSLLRDLAERNFEVAAQCIIDIAMRIISLEGAPRTSDGQEAIRRLSELSVLSRAFGESLAPIAGFRNVLAHEYTDVDWDLVHAHFSRLEDLRAYGNRVRDWLRRQASGEDTGSGSKPPDSDRRNTGRKRTPPSRPVSRRARRRA